MPAIIVYLLKLSISLGLIWVFYQLLLRRLTFYHLNRWYLLGYSFLSLFIPLINIGPLLENRMPGESVGLDLIPALGGKLPVQSDGSATAMVWTCLLVCLGIGGSILLARAVIRWRSLYKLRGMSRLIQDGPVRIYQVDLPITPFSFGRSIYINGEQHTDAEWEEIILHEYVHARQSHTVDILLAEFLCIVNWYNPFSWLMRHSIRQNLEFIADDKVLQNGGDKKSYQYHLLKVVGQSRYVLANNFNFSSLKKRIVMMNKVRTARVHLVKFLFVVPLAAVLLLAFRGMPAMAASTQDSAAIGPSVTTIDASGMPVVQDTGLAGGQAAAAPGQSFRKSLDTVPRRGDSLKNGNSTAPFPGTLRLKPSGKPLIVLNGTMMPEDFDLSSIKADDIESITVIKDESAKALYGARAADGVISVLTKDGPTYVTVAPIQAVMPSATDVPGGKPILVHISGQATTAIPVQMADEATVAGVTVSQAVPTAVSVSSPHIVLNVKSEAGAITLPVDKPITIAVEPMGRGSAPGIFIGGKGHKKKLATDVLYFVDGVETSPEDVARINPIDIGTVSVYKDEETMRKFGDRAKGGVVMIGMKKAEQK